MESYLGDLLRAAITIEDGKTADDIEKGFRDAAYNLRQMVTEAYESIVRGEMNSISEDTHDAHVQALGGK